MHNGEHLKTLLERTWAWVSELGRRQYQRNAGRVTPPSDSGGGGGGGGGGGSGGYEVDVSFADFCDRRGAILRSLEGLLARVT